MLLTASFVSLLPTNTRSLFNQLKHVQHKYLRFASHLEFLQQLKANKSIPAGLVVRSSANLHHHTCLQLKQQIIHHASSSIMDIVLLDCSINITSCTQKFLELASSLRLSVDDKLFHQLLEKLNRQGQQHMFDLRTKKPRNL